MNIDIWSYSYSDGAPRAVSYSYFFECTQNLIFHIIFLASTENNRYPRFCEREEFSAENSQAMVKTSHSRQLRFGNSPAK
jgi:hypothetical protein